MPRGTPRVGRLWMRRQLLWRRRIRSSSASLDSSTRSVRSAQAQQRDRHRPASVWMRKRRRTTARWRHSCSKATKCWTVADFGRSSTPSRRARSVLRRHARARRAHTMCTPCAHRTLRTCHATRRVRAGARGGNIGHGPKLSSWRPDDLVHHTRAAREAGRMRCVFGRAVSRGGDGAGAGRCAARARRRPLPVRLATHPTRRPARGLARGTVGRRGPSAVVVVPQLRTALASRGWLSRVLAALRTLDEPPSRSRPNGRLRCGRWGPVEAPVEATDAAASCSQVQLALGTAPAVLERARRQAQRTLLRRLSAVRLARVLHALRPG